jgi:hypothetical protein
VFKYKCNGYCSLYLFKILYRGWSRNWHIFPTPRGIPSDSISTVLPQPAVLLQSKAVAFLHYIVVTGETWPWSSSVVEAAVEWQRTHSSHPEKLCQEPCNAKVVLVCRDCCARLLYHLTGPHCWTQPIRCGPVRLYQTAIQSDRTMLSAHSSTIIFWSIVCGCVFTHLLIMFHDGACVYVTASVGPGTEAVENS